MYAGAERHPFVWAECEHKEKIRSRFKLWLEYLRLMHIRLLQACRVKHGLRCSLALRLRDAAAVFV